MARRKKSEGGGGGSWLDTYADMVTLLMTFFVMLFSMSTIQEEKWEKLLMAFQSNGTDTEQIIVPADQKTGEDSGMNAGAPPSGSGGETVEEGINFETLFEYLQQYVQENSLEASVELEKSDESVYIRFKDAVFFNPDSDYLRKDSREILDFLGGALKQVEDQLQLAVIAGHTAYVDGDYPVSDWRLSGGRATNVAIYLEDHCGIDGKKLQASGYGAKYPIDTNDTPEGRKRNRRVEMMILGDKASLTDPEIMDYFVKGTYSAIEEPQTGSITDILVPENAQKDPNEVTEPTESDGVLSEPEVQEPASSTPPPVSSAPLPPVSSAPPPPVSSTPPPASSAPPPVSSKPSSTAPNKRPTSSGSTNDLLSPPKK